MADTEKLHDELGNLLEAAQNDENHESANCTFAAAEQLALRIIDLDPTDADAAYAIALSWYHRWVPQAERRNCVKWLRRTAELAPRHAWVPLYLGYQFFDDKQYNEAVAEFTRVDQAFFASIELHWRNIKTRELLLCCRVRGEFPTVDLQSLKQLASDYIAADSVDCPIPTEIVKTTLIPDYRDRFDSDPRAVAKEVCRLIEGIGFQDVFPAQLTELQAIAHGAE